LLPCAELGGMPSYDLKEIAMREEEAFFGQPADVANIATNRLMRMTKEKQDLVVEVVG